MLDQFHSGNVLLCTCCIFHLMLCWILLQGRGNMMRRLVCLILPRNKRDICLDLFHFGTDPGDTPYRKCCQLYCCISLWGMDGMIFVLLYPERSRHHRVCTW